MYEITDERIPIKVWDEYPTETPHLLYENVFVQARNLANLPCAVEHVCLMPDYHLGYGMPIGGVLATKDAVVPNAVGVDIGCGMNALKTSIEAASISKEKFQKLREEVHKRVPVGKNRRKSPKLLPEEMYSQAPPVAQTNLGNAESSLGTLGSGNHFIEFQTDGDKLWVMLHSGSRNVGLQICNHYHHKAKELMADRKIKLPDSDLAYLTIDVTDYHLYIDEMNWAMRFAEENRAEMELQTILAMNEVLGEFDLENSIDTHHNFAAIEHHFGRPLMIHRKGAVKAQGLVTIPASMGRHVPGREEQHSYICKGLEPTASFNTCAHGAGRNMSRSQAKKNISREEAEAQMEGVVFGIRDGSFDEMPVAYKDINAVIEAMSDLVEVEVELSPLAVVKG